MTPLMWGMIGLLGFYSVVTLGSLYLYFKNHGEEQ